MPEPVNSYACSRSSSCCPTAPGAGERSVPFQQHEGYFEALDLYDQIENSGEPWTDAQRRFMRLFAEFQLMLMQTATTLSLAAREARYQELMEAKEAVEKEGKEKFAADRAMGVGAVSCGSILLVASGSSMKSGYHQEMAQSKANRQALAADQLKAKGYPNHAEKAQSQANHFQAIADKHKKEGNIADGVGMATKTFGDGSAQLAAADSNLRSSQARADQAGDNAQAQQHETTQTMSEQMYQQSLHQGEEAVQQKREAAKREQEALSRCMNFA